MSRSLHAKDIARKLRNREAAANLRADGWRLADIATELEISVGTVHNYLAEAKQEANRRAGDLGEQIRAMEDVRLLDIIDRGMAMVDAAAGKCDKHDAPIDFKAASALGTVLRASESRRWGNGPVVQPGACRFLRVVRSRDQQHFRLVAAEALASEVHNS